jgi:hypothetical protein
MISIQVPGTAADVINTVIVVDIKGRPLVYKPPVITTWSTSFITKAEAALSLPDEEKGVTIRYTTDGSDPVAASQLYKEKLSMSENTLLKARSFSGNKPVSEMVTERFEKVEPAPALSIFKADPGFQISYYEGDWNELPDFRKLTPKESEVINLVSPGKYKGKERYGVLIEGYIQLPVSAIYKLYLSSDDGSALYIDGALAIDNNGLHGMMEKSTTSALAAGFHSIRIEFFEKTGGDDVKLFIESMNMKKQELDAGMLFH